MTTSIDTFQSEARAFLDAHLDRRGEESFTWGEGSDRVGVLEEKTAEQEARDLAAAKARVEKALAFVKSLTPAQLAGAEDKTITWVAGGNERKMKGADYLQQFAMPNFFFFVTTAYDILRQCGVEIGKRDFMGTPPA